MALSNLINVAHKLVDDLAEMGKIVHMLQTKTEKLERCCSDLREEVKVLHREIRSVAKMVKKRHGTIDNGKKHG